MQFLLIGALAVAMIWLLGRVPIVTVPLVLALIVCAAFAPAMEWIRQHHGSSTLGAALALLIVLTVAASALVFVSGSISAEWAQLARTTQAGVHRLLSWSDTLPVSLDPAMSADLLGRVRGVVASPAFLSGARDGLGALAESGASVAMTAIIVFFVLKDGPQMWEFMTRPFDGIADDRANRIRRKTIDVFGGYARSTAAAALFDAVGILIGLLVLRVPLAVPLAILTLLLAFIPIVGPTTAGAIAALVALVSNGPLNAALVVLVVVVVNHLEGSILRPVLMAKTVNLHPLVVLVAIAAGTALGGVFGAVVAVPLTAAAWGVVQVWDGDDRSQPTRATSRARPGADGR